MLVAAIFLVVAACSGDVDEGPAASEFSSSTTPADTTTIPFVTTAPPATLTEEGFPQGESALDDMRAESFPDPLVPPEEIISGGPPPGGIPAPETSFGSGSHRKYSPLIQEKIVFGRSWISPST